MTADLSLVTHLMTTKRRFCDILLEFVHCSAGDGNQVVVIREEAHRFILAQSEYFQLLFATDFCKPVIDNTSKLQKITIVVDQKYEAAVLALTLHMMYLENLERQLTSENQQLLLGNCFVVLQLCQLWQFIRGMHYCVALIARHLDQLAIMQSLLLCSSDLLYPELQIRCYQWMKAFGLVHSNSARFLASLPKSTVHSILHAEDTLPMLDSNESTEDSSHNVVQYRGHFYVCDARLREPETASFYLQKVHCRLSHISLRVFLIRDANQQQWMIGIVADTPRPTDTLSVQVSLDVVGQIMTRRFIFEVSVSGERRTNVAIDLDPCLEDAFLAEEHFHGEDFPEHCTDLRNRTAGSPCLPCIITLETSSQCVKSLASARETIYLTYCNGRAAVRPCLGIHSSISV